MSRKRFSKDALKAGLSSIRGTASGFDIDAYLSQAFQAPASEPNPELNDTTALNDTSNAETAPASESSAQSYGISAASEFNDITVAANVLNNTTREPVSTEDSGDEAADIADHELNDTTSDTSVFPGTSTGTNHETANDTSGFPDTADETTRDTTGLDETTPGSTDETSPETSPETSDDTSAHRPKRGRPHAVKTDFGQVASVQDGIGRWATVSPNAHAMFKHLLTLHEKRIRINTDFVPDRSGKSMAYATRRRCVNELARIGAMESHARAKGIGAFRGMVFTLSPVMTQAFMAYTQGIRFELNDTTSETSADTGDAGIRAHALIREERKLSVSGDDVHSSDLLNTHPEYAFWRECHLSRKRIDAWCRGFGISEVVMDEYLRWAAFAMRNSSAPIQSPVDYFFAVLKKDGEFRCPAGYKSHEERQIEKREEALARRRMLQKRSVEAGNAEADALLVDEFDVIFKAGADDPRYAELESSVPGIARSNPVALRNSMLARFRELRRNGGM